MLSTKKTFAIFIPAILLVSFALFIRIIQYEPLFPDIKEDEQKTGEFVIPIFSEDPILGDKKSPITIIAFEDFSCPACKEQNTMLDTLIGSYPGKVKVIWKGLPVSEFPYSSQKAHAYAFCAHEQNKFGEFKRLAFTNSDNLSDTILDNIAQEIELNTDKLTSCLESNKPTLNTQTIQQIAQILNVQAIPTFFIDNKQIQTPKTQAEWKMLLNL